MAHSHLLRAVCTVAMLAAAPAFAQSNTPPASTGQGNMTNAPAMQQPMPNSTAPMGAPSTANQSQSSMQGQPMHHSTMAHHHAMRAARSNESQDSEVNRLNEESYQAAQQGRTFDAASNGMSNGTMSHGGMSHNGMSNGGMSNGGMSGAGSGGGMSNGAGASGGGKM